LKSVVVRRCGGRREDNEAEKRRDLKRAEEECQLVTQGLEKQRRSRLRTAFSLEIGHNVTAFVRQSTLFHESRAAEYLSRFYKIA
jgi:hypothetical protein